MVYCCRENKSSALCADWMCFRSFGPCFEFLKDKNHNINHNTQSGGKKLVEALQIFPFISAESRPCFVVVDPSLPSQNPSCLLSVAVLLSPSLPGCFIASLSLIPSFHISPSPHPTPLQLPFPQSLLSLWSHIKMITPPPPATWGSASLFVPCRPTDSCRSHQTEEPDGSLPERNNERDTLVCHALARAPPPAKTLSWLPSRLSPYSLSTWA